ncbi:MAG TPA: GNAT family N-acetyltransferase [Steroidobacteraceae bacterium]|nr:GNAT family N-acetyltransferase [Steroidobacteraceae bacterium]
MQDLLIRRGVPGDAAALAALAARTFTDAFASDNRPEDLQAHVASAYGVAQQSAELADPKTITLLAQRGEALIGYAQVRSHSVPSCVTQEKPIELQRFYLDRSAHGTGVAGELMSAVHDAARELGGRHLWLGVWERNARAIAFYSKMGFRKVGTHSFYVGSDRQTDDVMVVALRQQSGVAR